MGGCNCGAHADSGNGSCHGAAGRGWNGKTAGGRQGREQDWRWATLGLPISPAWPSSLPACVADPQSGGGVQPD